ncbi:MAG: ethylbenzene dehydrogenase-related protein [Nitrospirota bacterium]
MRINLFVVFMSIILLTAPTFGEEVLIAKKVSTAPAIDGKMDPVWETAKSTVIKVSRVPDAIVAKNKEMQKGKYAKNWEKSEWSNVSEAEMKAVYTDTDVFFFVKWKDSTKNDTMKIYHWDKEKKEYIEGKEKEDRFTIQFPISGDWNSCMLGGSNYVTDIWFWKAARTNPVGIAHDKYHIYSLTEIKGKYAIHYSVDGKTLYIARPNDGNVEPYKEKKIDPFTHQGDDVPRYEPFIPDNPDAADIKAKGVWENGMWTLEMGRKLDTGNKDSDAVIDPSKGTYFTIAVHDNNADHFHNTSGTVKLVFEK